ncbi:MAG TPA: hypothetical protein VM165_15575 [Planctomycetaceae bacterium]|nr:hypothetical protein [Planctomycetaceae bacterium]
MSTQRKKPCPKCGDDAVTKPLAGAAHCGHVLHTCIHSGNLILMGMGIANAAVNAFKSSWFTCCRCSHSFFAW